MCYKSKTEEYRGMIEAALVNYMNEYSGPDTLRSAMSYSLMAGGKRLRPCMTLAACEMLGGSGKTGLPYGCAIEMIHTYSLIHDDLPCMDDDDFRRGKPSCHKVYGEANAVLAGDGLLSYAFYIMAEAAEKNPVPGALKAIQAVTLGANRMVAGQVMDLASENAENADEDMLKYIQTNKTAAMIKGALLAGVFAADGGKQEINALGRFGDAYGSLFQMTDDILDIEGSFLNMGKTLGKDKEENKLTYPALAGLDAAKEKVRAAADEALAALELFGGKADYFRELTRLTICRKS